MKKFLFLLLIAQTLEAKPKKEKVLKLCPNFRVEFEAPFVVKEITTMTDKEFSLHYEFKNYTQPKNIIYLTIIPKKGNNGALDDAFFIKHIFIIMKPFSGTTRTIKASIRNCRQLKNWPGHPQG